MKTALDMDDEFDYDKAAAQYNMRHYEWAAMMQSALIRAGQITDRTDNKETE